MTAFEAHLSRWRVGLLLAGCLGFVAAGIWLLQINDDNPKRLFAAWAGIAVFGFFFLIGAPRLFQSGPELRIGPDGIWWRRWSDATIPWSAIRGIAIGEVRRQRFVCLSLTDPAAFPARGLAGRMAGANRALGFGDVALTVTGTDCRFDDLVDAVRRFAPASLAF